MIPKFDPNRFIPMHEQQQIALDKRHSGVIAILHGLRPTQVRLIKNKFSKRGKASPCIQQSSSGQLKTEKR